MYQTQVSSVVWFALLVSLVRSLDIKQYISHIPTKVTFIYLTTSAALLTSAFATFHPSEAAFRIWLLAFGAFCQCVLAAVWLTAWVRLPYMNEGRAHLSYQSVNVTASRQKGLCQQAEDSSLFTEGPDSVPKTDPAGTDCGFLHVFLHRQAAILLQNINPLLSGRDGFSMSSLAVGMPPENIFSHWGWDVCHANCDLTPIFPVLALHVNLVIKCESANECAKWSCQSVLRHDAVMF